MADKDALGRAGEIRAAEYLRDRGLELLAANWRCSEGEIDLVAGDAENIVIVEVKTRRGEGFGHPLEAVDARKRARLWRLAMRWAVDHRELVQGRRIRIDVVALTGPDPATALLEHLVDIEVP